MRALSAFDAQFLAGETDNTYGHYCAVAVFDAPDEGPGLTRNEVIGRVEERLDRMAPLRWQLEGVPLGLDHPVFVEVEVDVAAHVQAITARAPGGDRELADVVSDVMSEVLPRDRPLWDMYVVDGLADGRTALLTKLHHAAADGVAAAGILDTLLAEDAGAAGPSRAVVAGPSRRDLLVRGVRRTAAHPLRSTGAALRVLPHLDQTPTLRSVPGVPTLAGAARRAERLSTRVTGADRKLRPDALVAPRMRFNGPLSSRRSFAFASLPLAAVKDVKRASGVSFNDVVMAAVAGGLRRRLLQTGDLPVEPLVAFVPTSVRTAGANGAFGNAISSFIVPIPTHEDDPRRRIAFAHRAMSAAKARHVDIPTTLLADTNALIPAVLFGPVTSAAMRAMDAGLVAPPVNLTISNVPGPPARVRAFGCRLAAHYPASLIFAGVALNITVVSYDDQLEVGMVSDGETITDLWELVDAVREEFDDLHAAVSADAALR